MKIFLKTCILSMGVIIAAMPATGQTTFGVRAGLNIAYTRMIIDFSKFQVVGGGDPAIPPASPRQHAAVTPALRESVGVFLQQNFTGKIALREDLLYHGQGCKTYTFDTGPFRGSEIKLNYLMLPVSFVWMVHRKISLSGGTYAALLIHTPAGFVEPKDYGHSIDYGCQAGVEYRVSRKCSVGVAYYYGISNIYADGAPLIGRLRSGQLYLAYSVTSR